MEQNLDDVMRRIKKLLAIAEDSRGDANECAAAARMAESVMRKYQIEHADVIVEELKTGDAFDTADVGSSMDPEGASKESSGWAGILAVHVANLYDCQARYIRTPHYGKTIRFSGYKTDVVMARQTYCFVVNSMAAASRVYLKENRWAGRREANAFRSGYVSGVGASIKSLIAEKQAAMQEAASSRALVIVKERAVAEHFGAVKYYSSARRSYQSDAFAGGREAGQKLDVGRRGIEGGAKAAGRIA